MKAREQTFRRALADQVLSQRGSHTNSKNFPFFSNLCALLRLAEQPPERAKQQKKMADRPEPVAQHLREARRRGRELANKVDIGRLLRGVWSFYVLALLVVLAGVAVAWTNSHHPGSFSGLGMETHLPRMGTPSDKIVPEKLKNVPEYLRAQGENAWDWARDTAGKVYDSFKGKADEMKETTAAAPSERGRDDLRRAETEAKRPDRGEPRSTERREYGPQLPRNDDEQRAKEHFHRAGEDIWECVGCAQDAAQELKKGVQSEFDYIASAGRDKAHDVSGRLENLKETAKDQFDLLRSRTTQAAENLRQDIKIAGAELRDKVDATLERAGRLAEDVKVDATHRTHVLEDRVRGAVGQAERQVEEFAGDLKHGAEVVAEATWDRLKSAGGYVQDQLSEAAQIARETKECLEQVEERHRHN